MMQVNQHIRKPVQKLVESTVQKTEPYAKELQEFEKIWWKDISKAISYASNTGIPYDVWSPKYEALFDDAKEVKYQKQLQSWRNRQDFVQAWMREKDPNAKLFPKWLAGDPKPEHPDVIKARKQADTDRLNKLRQNATQLHRF
jgi:hypothetical protein